MNSFPEDLWSIILARLPLNNITTCKLVCKQWKSIVESPYFRDLFTSLPQNSQASLWSLHFRNDITDAKAHYGCEPSLGSHILSFLTNKLENERDQYIVCSYNHVGLILICDVPKRYKRRHYYVANSFSQECIELPYHHHDMNYPLGIVTQTENGVVLSYKVVLLDFGFCGSKTELSFLIYSSEKGLWSLKTFYLPFSLPYEYFYRSVSLNGSLYWVNRNSDNEDVIVSQDFYAIGTDSNRCRVALFPDLDKHPKFRRACTISQRFFMYTNIVSEDKLRVWRLKSGEWQLVYEISLEFVNPCLDHIPLEINNLFDAKTIHCWSISQKSLLSYYLCDGKLVHSSDGRILSSIKRPRVEKYIKRSHFPSYVLPSRNMTD